MNLTENRRGVLLEQLDFARCNCEILFDERLASSHPFVPAYLAELVWVVQPLGCLPFGILKNARCQNGLPDKVVSVGETVRPFIDDPVAEDPHRIEVRPFRAKDG